MLSGQRLRWFVRAVTHRPLHVMIAVAALALGGTVLALRLEPSAATDTLVSSSSDSFRATERFKKDFGDEAVVVLVKGNLQKTVLTDDLAAVLASGATVTAGFAVLIASDIRMLRDFGILTVVDLSVSLIGVMIVLPAVLVWAERHGAFGLRDLDPRPFLRKLADVA